jgi:hypothetical protein
MIVRLVKGIALCASFAVVLASMASPAYATPDNFGADAPEIASGAVVGALGLLAGGILIVKDRIRRK